MSAWFVVLLFSVGAVLFLVVGLSLTLMIKGRHIDSEISTNRHMRARGITCAAKDALGSSGTLSSPSDCADACSSVSSCASCAK